MTTHTTPIFLDVCPVMTAAGLLGGVSQPSDFATAYSRGHVEIDIMRYFATSTDVVLVETMASLKTLHYKLQHPSVGTDGRTEFEPLTREEADATLGAFVALIKGSGGRIVSSGDTRAGYHRATSVVPAHLVGKAKGQIDHEDLMILGGCFAELDRQFAAGASLEECRVVLVTNDKGMLNCARVLAGHGIAVVDAARYARATDVAA